MKFNKATRTNMMYVAAVVAIVALVVVFRQRMKKSEYTTEYLKKSRGGPPASAMKRRAAFMRKLSPTDKFRVTANKMIGREWWSGVPNVPDDVKF
jgi:hypothetical protein